MMQVRLIDFTCQNIGRDTCQLYAMLSTKAYSPGHHITGIGVSLRDRRKARRSIGGLPDVHSGPDQGLHEGSSDVAGRQHAVGSATLARAIDVSEEAQLSADLSYDIAMTPLAGTFDLESGLVLTNGSGLGEPGGDGDGAPAQGGCDGANDDEASLPLAYDGHGSGAQADQQVKKVWGFAGKELVGAVRPCPSGVLSKYEASCHELLIGLQHQRQGVGNGICSLVPHGGLLAPPPPLEKPAVEPVAEEVVWEGSNVTNKVDFTKGVHVEWQEKSKESDEALAAVAAFWGKGLMRRDENQRLPRNTRKELHSLESHHVGSPDPDITNGRNKGSRRRRGRKSKENQPEGAPASRDASLERPVLQFAPTFAPKGEGMTLHLESLQVQGLGVKVGSWVRVELFVGKNIGAQATKASTSKKKLSAAHAVEWGKMTTLPVEGDMLDEGVLHMRILEPKLLGEPACLGTAAVALCEAARHEDVEEDPLYHGKWVDLQGAGADFTVDEQAPEPVATASVRVVLVVRATDSAHAHLDLAIDAVNCRQFGKGLREAEAAKDRFLALRNTRMAAQALDIISEAKQRQSVVMPLVMRRLGLLADRLSLRDLSSLRALGARGGSLQLGWAPGDERREAAAGEEAVDVTVPENVCLVSFEDVERGGVGGIGEMTGGEGDELVGKGEQSLQRMLEEAADLIMEKKSFKRRMRGMAHHLDLDEVGKARAILPVRLMYDTGSYVHAEACTLACAQVQT